MTRDLITGTDRERRLNEVLLAFVEAVQAGRAPDRERMLAAHPDLRPELEECFASHDELERLAVPLRAATKETPHEEALVCDSDDRQRPEVGVEPQASSATPELGQLGDFRLLREVGRGGMGVVYEAEQISLRRRVALKVLPFAAAIDPRQLQRFKNEAMAAAHLRHENIVPVFAVGSERGVHYYAMQFIEGQSLAALIGELRRLTGDPTRQPPAAPSPSGTAAETTGPYFAREPQETFPDHANRLVAASVSRERSSGDRRYFDWVAGLGRQAALALEHAHQMGIVHRDIKPANLLLDPQRQLWVTDFGLAQMSGDAGLTVTGELLGTLRYASPEQALARRGLVDHRSDLYSLGTTLYELLTLRPIFVGRDRRELLRQIADEDPLPPRSVEHTIPAELETIVLKAVAKEPGERYATAQELAEDLQRFLEDRPIRARRPTLLEMIAKWSRRHRTVVRSGVGLLVLLTVGFAISTALVARAGWKTQEANEQLKAALAREQQRAQEASEERHRAEKNYQKAREAVDELAQVGAEELANKPELGDLRRRLLEAVLVYYQDLVEQRQDDPSSQDDLATARSQVRAILGELSASEGFGRVMFLAHLLDERSVQKDLEVLDFTESQAKGLRVRVELLFKQAAPRLSDFRKLTPDERKQHFQDMTKVAEDVLKEGLTSEQLQRLQQIALQLHGARAWSDPEVAKALELTDEQKRKIQTTLEEARRAMPGPPGIGGPPPKSGRGPDDSWKATNLQLAGVLTSDQEKRWSEMIGKRFEGVVNPGFRGHFGPPPQCQPPDGP
jgi:serine/threonine protein kinase